MTTNNIVFWAAPKAISGPREITKVMQGNANNRNHRIFTRRKQGSTYREKPHDLVINWGNSLKNKYLTIEDTMPVGTRLLNKKEAVERASDKLLAFGCFSLSGLSAVPFTQSIDEVRDWLDAGHIIVGRSLLRGHSGNGILMIHNKEELDNLPPYPLYTKYIKKKDEFRVHIVGNKVIDIVQKRNKKAILEQIRIIDYQVRNYQNGWIYCHNDIQPVAYDRLSILGLAAIEALGLDFGAVDIIYNQRYDTFYVLEVNTAPGLSSPTTIKAYADAFNKEIIND